ncbi:MAG: ABC transporter permease [bacterium]
MLVYISRRLLMLIPVLLGISFVTFFLQYVSLSDPIRAQMGQRGDPEVIARIRADLWLDRSFGEQYALYMGRLLLGSKLLSKIKITERLDFTKTDSDLGHMGRSYRQRRLVTHIIAERLPKSAKLALAAMALAIVFGITAGVISAVKQYSAIDAVVMVLALIGISTPIFWLGMMMILVFGVWLKVLPISGYGDGSIRNLIMPSMALAALQMGYIARMTRSSMLEVVRQDYIRTARAKGTGERAVILKHALKNALIPVVTIIGISTANLIVGAPLTESVFAWPGIGRQLVASINQRDLPVVMGITLFMATVYVLANLVVDVSYALLDPRIRYD